jgi:hypothetical protein
MRRTTLGLVFVVVGGCGSSGTAPAAGRASQPAATAPAASSAIELPTYGPGDAYPDALAAGTLERQGSCVLLRGSVDYELIWPSGTIAQLDGSGLVVTEPAGTVFHEHEQVSMGGGEYAEADFPRPIAGLAEACRGHLFWLAAPREG